MSCKECDKKVKQLKLFWRAIEVLKSRNKRLVEEIKIADKEIDRLWDDIELR
tara:strand:+ start:529 stop:684 length:156 start_codon:yes stop_codon:yes gene_type:complete